MEIVNAEGWKAVFLIDSKDDNPVDDYLPSGLAVNVIDIRVWASSSHGENSLVGLDLEPVEGGYTEEDLDWAPDTVLGFIGYLPPDASLAFLDKRAIVIANELNTIEWVKGEAVVD